MGEWRLAGAAGRQLGAVLGSSRKAWGELGAARYWALLMIAMQDVADVPDRIGTRRIDDRTSVYPIRYSRRRVTGWPGRVGRPRHILVFQTMDDGIVDILGLYYDGMPARVGVDRVLRDDFE